MKEGILLLGQIRESAGRGIAGPRLRTAAQKAGFAIDVIDSASHFSNDEIFELIDVYVRNNIKFIGFSTSWIAKSAGNIIGYEWLSESFFKKIRNKYSNLIIITGGHQSHAHEHILKHSNFHFQGFSDLSFVEFLKFINNQPNNLKFSVTNKNVKLIESNIDYPITDPNDIETIFIKEDRFLSHQPLPIELSRGCIFRCTFCRHPFQGKKDYDSYQRSPENLAYELQRNYELFGTTRYSILDDTINDSLEKLHRLEKAIELAKLPNFQFVGYIRPELLVTKPEMIPKLAQLGLRGAYMGFESFKNSTRKIIGRGMDFERVKDAVYKLAEINNKQVLITGSLIVGLPDETAIDIISSYEFLVKNANNFCRDWNFHPLVIINDNSLTNERSSFDKNPNKFKYELTDKYNWKNKYFTKNQAIELATLLTVMSSKKTRNAGWAVAGCWNLNMTEQEIQNGFVSDIEFHNNHLNQLRKRARMDFEFFTNK